MKKEIVRIFSRQYKRLEAELLQNDTSQSIMEKVSKYFRFCEKDILNIINNKEREENGTEETKTNNNTK